VYIPGGPVELYDWFRVALRGEYKSLYGVDVACTAGFWIDRQEVTRKEYAEFLAATGYAPLPAGWTRRILDGREPLRAPDLPVTGVRPEDAEAYALWRGKRLVTPVEWAKASRLASMVFLEEQQKSLYVANEELLDIDGREREAVRLKLAELRAQGFKVDRNARIQLGIQTELDAERHRVVQDLLDRSGFLVQGTAAGGVESDISIYGVRDVTSNAPEWLLQNLGKQGRDVTQKPLYIPLKPPQFLANGQLNPIAEAIGGSLSAAPGAPWWGGNRPAPGQDIRRPLRDGNVRPFANWERQGYTPLNPMSDALWGGLSRLIGMDPDYDLKFFSVTGNGFRCAR